MSDQNYDCWYTVYPSTHVRSGQTVQVVTRAFHDEIVGLLSQKVDTALRAISKDDLADKEKLGIIELILSRTNQ